MADGEKIVGDVEGDSDGSGHHQSTPPIHEGRLLKKLDLRLLPAVGALYLLSFLDRSNGKGCPGSVLFL